MVAVAGYWWFPKQLKLTLSNGGGDIIRHIVKEENAEQTRHYTEEPDRRFERHESQEDRRFTKIEGAVSRKQRR